MHEPTRAAARRAIELAEALGHRAIAVERASDASRVVAEGEGADVILAGDPGGDALVRAAREMGDRRHR